jgi:type II secretory pathway component PulK
MGLEQEKARFHVREARARNLAAGGLNAAIGEIQAALRRGQTPAPSYSFLLPIYLREDGQLVEVSQEVEVRVHDESSRLNPNSLPDEALRALGLSAEEVRNLRERLPENGAPGGGRRWLASVDELLARGIVSAETFRNLPVHLLTVHSTGHPANPQGTVNLNSAPAEALAIIFNVSTEEAQSLAVKRPFTSWEDVVRKVGREPATYNIRPGVAAPREMPAALALQSRSFRLEGSARVRPTGSRQLGVRSTVSAVVTFGDGGDYEVLYWSKRPSEGIEFPPPEVAEPTGAASAETDAAETTE